MKRNTFASGQADFFAGLAIVLPAVVSVAVLVWLFNGVAKITDLLLFFLPRSLTHERGGAGPMYWYWSLAALTLAIALVVVVGRLTRVYVGKKMIQLVDLALLRIPLLNKIYGTLKQANEAFTSSNKSSFKQVVLIQYPRPGTWSLGFLTGEKHPEVQTKIHEKVVSVFVPTTPNPTSGFLLLVPESEITRLEMSVADGIKYIISLGAITPAYSPPAT